MRIINPFLLQVKLVEVLFVFNYKTSAVAIKCKANPHNNCRKVMEIPLFFFL